MKGKILFVCGGSGTWGKELTRQCLELDVKEIRIFSRGEISQVMMKRDVADDRVKFIIGDVRDYQAVEYAMQGSDFVFNLAALKHVGICEEQPQEAVKTNVDGTINLIHAAIKNNVKKFVFASTDKAIYPSNLYGMTKGICERLVIQANCLSDTTDFTCIRSGNIMGSSGSVIPLFIQMAKEKNEITVTDKKMTRFFLPVAKVARLMIDAIEHGVGGEIFIPEMPSFYIEDLASLIMDFHGKEGQIKEIGARAGEKTHEMLVSPHESAFTKKFGDNRYVILPSINTNRDYSKFLGGESFQRETYSSSDAISTKEFLYQMLYHNKFLV